MDSTLIRCLQLITAILGLIFSIQYGTQLLIICFAVALVYLIIVFLGVLLGRTIFPGRAQMVFDLAIGIVVLVLTVWATIEGNFKATMFILAIICGYILGPLLIITGVGL